MTAQELASVIWNIKEVIRNIYDDSEVEDVILPFTLLRRLDCVLDAHRADIMEQIKDLPEEQQKFKLKYILKKAGLSFFNTSGLSLHLLLGNPAAIGDNFKNYLDGFTDNVKDILSNFVHSDSSSPDLSQIYSRLERGNKLFAVTQLFVQQADLSPERVSNAMMGTIFEIVIRMSKESTNTKAGQFYTPREIVRLLVSLTMCGREAELFEAGRHFSIYDPCCGTGGMLTVGKEYLQEVAQRPDMKVYLYGQELNEKTYAICKSDLLIKGDTQSLDDQLFCGDTLADDKLRGKSFNFMLANPPFGVDWGKDEKVKAAVMAENSTGKRFEAGLPSTNDGSLLFLMHMISKMDETNGSRIGIVLNGSPLFNGAAGSGWSNIRKMFLDRNLLDCIVALPKNLFYGTDINTYLWILDNKRPASRAGKVLLINANYAEMTTTLQKSLGKKRFEISAEAAAEILECYRRYEPMQRKVCYEKTGEMETVDFARLMDYDDFLYTTVAVDRPLRMWYEGITTRYAELSAEESFKPTTAINKLLAAIAGVEDIDARRSDAEFFAYLKAHKISVKATELPKVRKAYGIVCPDAPEIHTAPLKPESPIERDSSLADTENIPMKQNIEQYFEREVLRFVPDAWMDRSKDKVGCEFPFTRLFYKYRPLRSSEEILAELTALDTEMEAELRALKEQD